VFGGGVWGGGGKVTTGKRKIMRVRAQEVGYQKEWVLVGKPVHRGMKTTLEGRVHDRKSKNTCAGPNYFIERMVGKKGIYCYRNCEGNKHPKEGRGWAKSLIEWRGDQAALERL